MDKKCAVCDKMYFAKRKDSIYCSSSCRKKASRSVAGSVAETTESIKQSVVAVEQVAKQVEKDKAQLLVEQVEAERVESEDWKNSAEKKTQAEIKEHYSLKNFPSRPRYYSANGGGAGGFSPYLSSDPRSVAYSLK